MNPNQGEMFGQAATLSGAGLPASDSPAQRVGLSLPILTNSRMKAARACLRYDKLRYRLGYKSTRERITLRFGTLFHAALEAWWLACQEEDVDRLDAAIDAIEGHIAEPAAELKPGQTAFDAFDRAKAEALIIGYHERWKHEPLEMIAVEAEFEGPLLNPATGAVSKTFRRGGKIDALTWDYSSGYKQKKLVEHKTSSEDIRQGSPYWLRLRMDSQVSTYVEGSRFLGHGDVEGCIYDVIKKPTIKPKELPELTACARCEATGKIHSAIDAAEPEKKCPDCGGNGSFRVVLDGNGQRCKTKNGKQWRQTPDAADPSQHLKTRPETPDEFKKRILESIAEDPGAYFQRGDVVRLEAEMREAMADDWNFAAALRVSIRDDVTPRNPDACMRYGSLCDFFGVCTGAESLDDPSKFIQLDDPNSELSAKPGAMNAI